MQFAHKNLLFLVMDEMNCLPLDSELDLGAGHFLKKLETDRFSLAKYQILKPCPISDNVTRCMKESKHPSIASYMFPQFPVNP